MNILKAGTIGLLGALVILIVMFVGTRATGLAPFNLSPSAAFLQAFAISPMPWAPLLHFAYGFAGAVILFWIFGHAINVVNAIALALLQWLLLMVVYGPLIGWGVFGFGADAHALPDTAPLYLGQTTKYIVMTLVLHLVYGVLNGMLIPRWINAGVQSKYSR